MKKYEKQQANNSMVENMKQAQNYVANEVELGVDYEVEAQKAGHNQRNQANAKNSGFAKSKANQKNDVECGK